MDKNLNWKPFLFDGNSWFGRVDSLDKFLDLLGAYDNDLDLILTRAKECPNYMMDMPNFGLRIEHIGPKTLGDWGREQKVDFKTLVNVVPSSVHIVQRSNRPLVNSLVKVLCDKQVLVCATVDVPWGDSSVCSDCRSCFKEGLELNALSSHFAYFTLIEKS